MNDDDIKALREALAVDFHYEWGDAAEWVHATGDETEAAYIAACLPERIARLLDEVERLRAELASAYEDQQTFTKDNGVLLQRLRQAEAERDALREALLSGNPAKALEMLLKAHPLDVAIDAAKAGAARA